MSGETACGCDLVTEGVAQWWINLPGLHHLPGCPMCPTPVPSEVAETTAGEREVEALAKVLHAAIMPGQQHPGGPEDPASEWPCRKWAATVLASPALAALLDRVRREEGAKLLREAAAALDGESERLGGMYAGDCTEWLTARAASVGRGEGP